MKKKWAVAALVAGLCASVISAQESEWTAYVRFDYYGYEANQFTETGETGNVLYPVAPPEWDGHKTDLYLNNVDLFVIAPTQDHLLYTMSNISARDMYRADEPYLQTIVEYDTATETVILHYDLPPFALATLSEGSFDAETGRFAAVITQPMSLPEEGTVEDYQMLSMADRRMEVLVFDPAVGNDPIATLTDPVLDNRYFEMGGRLDQFRDGKVFFTVETSGGDGRGEENFVWDLTTNTLTNDQGNGFNWASDILKTTGESVRSIWNSEYPSSEDVGGEFIYFQANVVEVWTPDDEAWHVLYQDPLRNFGHAHFVQNGERILVSTYDAEDRDGTWLLLERDGTLVSQVKWPPDVRSMGTVIMTPNGFLLDHSICSNGECRSTIIDEYDTRSGLDLSVKRPVVTFVGSVSIIWFQPTHPITPDYMDWTFLTGAQ